MGQVVRGDFALLDGDVHDLVQAGAIAGGIDVRQAGLHLRVGDDAAVFDADPDALQAERGDVRDPAQRKENLLRAHAHGLALVLEGNFLPVADAAGIEEFGAGVKVMPSRRKTFSSSPAASSSNACRMWGLR